MTHRYIARIILEAKTPLFVGSGRQSLLTDALVQKDAYGFPMIPGTALTGVLRHALEDGSSEKGWDDFFGFQDRNEGVGSKVRISSAYLILKGGKIANKNNWQQMQEEFPYFNELPARQHVRIDDKGTAEKGGLFNNEVVYAGCRFVFEIELRSDGNDEDKNKWNALLRQLSSPSFRVGQGTRNGYGHLAVHECRVKTFDLTQESDFEAYLNYNPDFNECNDILNSESPGGGTGGKTITHFQLKLKPDDFFLFGAGAGDDDVDNVPVTEKKISYDEAGTIQLSENEYFLIPASSVKGALAHRTAFHYNRLKERYVDKLEPVLGMDIMRELYTGAGNKAVNELFGLGGGFKWSEKVGKRIKEGNFDYECFGDARRGKVIIDDIFIEKADTKIFNHVAIDRFTAGALKGQGALFSEKVVAAPDSDITIDVFVEDASYEEKIYEALKKALSDIANGLLPLGGMTTKGHGYFTGTLNEKKILV